MNVSVVDLSWNRCFFLSFLSTVITIMSPFTIITGMDHIDNRISQPDVKSRSVLEWYLFSMKKKNTSITKFAQKASNHKLYSSFLSLLHI